MLGRLSGMSNHAASSPVPSCPRCGASRVLRWGWIRTVRAPDRRRFRCKGCDRTFSQYTGKAVAGSWYPHRWTELCLELVAQSSVRFTARRLGVAPSTAFRWRHRTLQALADHRERTGLGRVGSGAGAAGVVGSKAGSAGVVGSEAGAAGVVGSEPGPTAGVVGVMGLPYKVRRGKGPELEPSRFFRLLLATDAAGRVAIDHDVPGEFVGPPGSPLPLWDWAGSDRARNRFPLGPPDRVPSPRRLLSRWCVPGSEIRWVGWRYYDWAKVAAEQGMTAVYCPSFRWPTGEDAGDPLADVAERARVLASTLKGWFRRYGGVSTRWLRGYLALFAELYQGGDRAVALPAIWAFRTRGRTTTTAARRRTLRQRATSLAWRLAQIGVLAPEGPEARDRRGWVR